MRWLSTYLFPLMLGAGFGANAVAVFYRPDPIWHGLTALLCLAFIFNYLAQSDRPAPPSEKSINGQAPAIPPGEAPEQRFSGHSGNGIADVRDSQKAFSSDGGEGLGHPDVRKLTFSTGAPSAPGDHFKEEA